MKGVHIIICIGLIIILLIVLTSNSQQCPTNSCLADCDKITDECYKKCPCKDGDCVKNCYQIKSTCYMKCLDEKEPSDTCSVQPDCGCGK